jgi:hypothetical protein
VYDFVEVKKGETATAIHLREVRTARAVQSGSGADVR